MAISQNGWSVITTRDLTKVEVRGVAMVPGVRRSVAPLFQDLCERLAQIEPPVEGWCWGWAHRPIRGQTGGYSNHASATAIDWNAPRHARGGPRYAGFTTSQVKQIHGLLTRYDQVIRWGGDYQQPPHDPMHFEVVGTPDQVHRVIDRLKGREGEWDEMASKAEIGEVVAAQIKAYFGRIVAGGQVSFEKTIENTLRVAQENINETRKTAAQVTELKRLCEAFLLAQADQNPTGNIP